MDMSYRAGDLFGESNTRGHAPAEPPPLYGVGDAVVRYYAPLVYRLALTKTKSSHDAEDIFSDVFLRLLSHDKPFESEEHRKAWLIRVTINCCNSHFVAPWRKQVDAFADLTMAEETAEEGQDLSEVYDRVLALPSAMREVILLYYYENMSVREIADALGASEDSIKKRLSRARAKLRLSIEAQN